MQERRTLAAGLLAACVGLAFVAIIAYWILHPSRPQVIFKEVIGTKDEIYYSHAASKQDAQALGKELQSIGFFNDRGATVFLSKGTAGTVVSFVLNEGAWNHAETIYSFEEIGRRIVPAVGVFPIKVRLIDSSRRLRRELTIGKAIIGAMDEVYYYGSATEADANALGAALKAAGFFVDSGASVALSKVDGTAISFVLGDGAWNLPGTVERFEALTRRVAASVGGLPIELRLVNPKMEPKKEVEVSSLQGAPHDR